MNTNARLSFANRQRAWTIAREAVLEARGDRTEAIRIGKERAKVHFIDPATLWLIIRISIWIINWLINSNIFDPPEKPIKGAPGFTKADLAIDAEVGINSDPDESDVPEESTWGTPPAKRRLPPYQRAGYSPRGEINSRDAGSIGADLFQIQSIILPTSFAIEALAESAMPDASRGAFFSSAYFLQSIAFLILKVLGAWLRNRGESFIRDLIAWAWQKLTSYVGSLWPFSRKARKERRQSRRRRVVERLRGPRRRRRAE